MSILKSKSISPQDSVFQSPRFSSRIDTDPASDKMSSVGKRAERVDRPRLDSSIFYREET